MHSCHCDQRARGQDRSCCARLGVAPTSGPPNLAKRLFNKGVWRRGRCLRLGAPFRSSRRVYCEGLARTGGAIGRGIHSDPRRDAGACDRVWGAKSWGSRLALRACSGCCRRGALHLRDWRICPGGRAGRTWSSPCSFGAFSRSAGEDLHSEGLRRRLRDLVAAAAFSAVFATPAGSSFSRARLPSLRSPSALFGFPCAAARVEGKIRRETILCEWLADLKVLCVQAGIGYAFECPDASLWWHARLGR